MTDSTVRLLHQCTFPGCEKERASYSKMCEEHRNPRQPRIETERCSAKLRVPTANGKGEVVFQCQERIETGSEHGKESIHSETGLVLMADGTYRRYSISWEDAGIAAVRQRPSRARKVASATAANA